MSWGAVAGAAVSVVGGAMLSGGAGEAAGAQQAGAGEQIAESRRQFNAVQKLLSPWVNTGTDALTQQRILLGLGSGGGFGGGAGGFGAVGPKAPPTTFQPGQSGDPLWEQILGEFNAAHTAQFGTPINRPWGSDADSQAVYDRLAAEYRARSPATAAAGGQAPMTAEQEQAAAVSQFEKSPYFQAITRQSEDAILQNASATGGLRGGNIQDALSKNRPILLQNLIDKQLANLSGLSASGQSAAAGVGTAGMNTGAAVNQAIGQGAAAQAGGILGQSNANVSALGQIGGLFANKLATGGIGSPFTPPISDNGYSVGQGSAYGGTRAGL